MAAVTSAGNTGMHMRFASSRHRQPYPQRTLTAGAKARAGQAPRSRRLATQKPAQKPAPVPAQAPAPSAAQTNAQDADRGVLVSKCLKSRLSRRQTDVYVRDGRISVNGEVAHLGQRLFPGDIVTCDGEVVDWQAPNTPAEAQHVYIKYWKPAGITCTTEDGVQGNVIDAVAHPQRLFTIGRLDKASTGLLLLTNDGRVVNNLLRSSEAHEKQYVVRVDAPLSLAHVQQLRNGVVINTAVQRPGRTNRRDARTAVTQPCTIKQSERMQLGARELQITLKEGRNRQIRKMCEALGYRVKTLHRTHVAGITLQGLQEGKWKDLTAKEMKIINSVLRSAAELQRA